jgi:hypothetical protein
VNFDALPRPRPDERQAIGSAFDRLLGVGAVPAAYHSRWLAAALSENTSPWVPTRASWAARAPMRPARRRP